MKPIDASTTQTLYIGYAGESNHTVVAFPTHCLTDSPEKGTFTLFVQRNGDEQAYPAPITLEDGKVLWTVREVDAAKIGHGEVQLVFTVPGETAKSKIWAINVFRSLTVSEDQPEPSEDWVNAVIEAADRAEQAATDIKDLTVSAVSLPIGSDPTVTKTKEEGRPYNLEFGIPEASVPLVQTTGQSTTDVMSQKAVTDVTNAINQTVESAFTTIEDTGIYLSRESAGGKEIGNRELLNKLVGGTIVWNQLIPDGGGDATVPANHVYYYYNGTTETIDKNNVEVDIPGAGDDVIIDLTLMFGTEIADYIYTTGGVDFIKPFIERADKSYNAGELVSVKTSAHVTKDANDTTLGTYPIDNTELRGKLNLDANNKLYYDGDEYATDGTVMRKYGVVDLGTLTWQYRSAQNAFSLGAGRGFSKTNGNVICAMYPQYKGGLVNMPDMTIATFSAFNANDIVIKNSNYTTAASFKSAMSGVYLIYERTTSTTESASPIPNPQIVDANGTESFTDARSVPMPVQAEAKYLSKAIGESIGDFLGVYLPPIPASGSFVLKSTNGVLSWNVE